MRTVIRIFSSIRCRVSKKIFSSHNELPFLPERKQLGKVEKLVCSTEGKEKYAIYIRALK